MDSLEKTVRWELSHGTHLKRLEIILERYVRNLGDYVDLFGKYPANSPEFRVEVTKLYGSLGDICTESKEVLSDLAADMEIFKDVITTFQREIENE